MYWSYVLDVTYENGETLEMYEDSILKLFLFYKENRKSIKYATLTNNQGLVMIQSNEFKTIFEP